MSDYDDYHLPGPAYRNLLRVMRELYDASKPLTGDRRRDLANTMHANLTRATPIGDPI